MGQGLLTSKVRLCVCVLAVSAASAMIPPAHADTGIAIAAAESASQHPASDSAFGEPSVGADSWNSAQITVGEAAAGGGRVAYGRRSSFSGSAGVVSFSNTRPRSSTPRYAATAGPGPVLSSAALGQMPRYLPVSGNGLTSSFGMRRHPVLGIERRHSGLDLAAAYGTPIAATADGTVAFANWNGGYGLLVAVDHGGGIETRYGHMARLAVAPGQRVRTGDLLGYVGSTGLSTGPHVHYEVRVNGAAVNPYGNLRPYRKREISN